MTQEHPNSGLLAKLDIRDFNASAALLSEDFFRSYFNPNLADIEGDTVGVEGLEKFFGVISEKTGATFWVEVIPTAPVGKGLVVVHARDDLVFEANPVVIDVVVVWRIIDGKLAEGWGSPSAFALAA